MKKNENIIDLRSDTVTKPTKEMREAMLNAIVGDDVYHDDPTVNNLQEYAANLFGFEDALFVPSGTMGNQLCIMTHTNKGDEIIVSRDAHIFQHEVGAVGLLSNANMNTIQFANGIYNPDLIKKAIRSENIHYPKTSLICVENPLSNGRVVPLSVLEEIFFIANERNIKVHMDGARIFNAAVALKVDVKEIAKYAHSVMFCLSKGLCAPVGSIVVSDKKFIEKARKYKKLIGGGMRQVGILAAAGQIALTKMVDRLNVDHDNAKFLAQSLDKCSYCDVDMSSVVTNMVFFRMKKPAEFIENLPFMLKKYNIIINDYENDEFRFVMSNDVSRKDIEYVLSVLDELCV